MRINSAKRVKIAHRAEDEILRFGRPDPTTGLRPHALWHKHVHNVELDAMQVLKMIEMDQQRQTVDLSCRRTGKTTVKELHALEFLATTPYQEEGIVAPRYQQAQIGLNYHLDAIRRSPLLKAYMAYKKGREQMNDGGYQFYNGSRCAAYGIMSQIDGDAISLASIDEIDDCPQDRLLSRFLPMLGSARRLGADRSVSFQPQIRITGVYKGADVLAAMLASGEYHLLPTVDVYLAREMGMVNEAWVATMRAQQTEHEWLRQFLCLNTRATNWIHERYVRLALATGLEARIEIAGPLPGLRYKKRGLLSIGYDHTGHGETPNASRSAVVVIEQVGNFASVIYARSWPPGTDDAVLTGDLIALWDYFRPDTGIGDAYAIGILTAVNDELFRRGLTDIDRRTIGDGQSTASNWQDWPFAPIRFDGPAKHIMASSLRAAFHQRRAAIASFDEKADDPVSQDWQLLVRQLGNVKALPTQAAYNSYKQANPKIGDDFFDATCAAVHAVNVRQEGCSPTLIIPRRQTRAQLLGLA